MDIDRMRATQDSLLRYGQKAPLTSLPCATCNQDTAHRGGKCLTCGTLYVAPRLKRTGFFIVTRAVKQAEARRRAEESRRKWEGGK